MSLVVVSTPIGNDRDITLRAVDTLKRVPVVICEELKPARVLLKRIGAGEKEWHQLNEHSRPDDVKALLEICRTREVALISDCGTPGFCDPGAALVEACFDARIPVDVNPGVTSLTALLALSGEQFREFHFVGFLPAEKTRRAEAVRSLKSHKVPFIIMDTPYRLQATLTELAAEIGGHRAVLGVDLTGENHAVKKSKIRDLAAQTWPKAPFVLMVIP